MARQVIQLNNDYTNAKRNQAMTPAPRRKHLGFILVVAILLFSLASVSLVHAYQNLQKQVAIEKTTIQQHKTLTQEVATKSQEIQKLQDPQYLLKFARSEYDFTQGNEKVFTTGNGTAIDGTNP